MFGDESQSKCVWGSVGNVSVMDRGGLCRKTKGATVVMRAAIH